MAETFLGNIGEFLIGLIILPRIVTLIWALAIPLLGLNAQAALIGNVILSLVFILITWHFRKMIAFGFFVGTVWDIFSAYMILSGKI